MNRLYLLLSILVISQSATAGYVSGFDLNSWGTAHDRIDGGRAASDDYAINNKFYGYVMGVHDALDGVVFCSPEHAKAGQIQAVVQKYVRERPGRWNEGANFLVAEALKEAFPCKK